LAAPETVGLSSERLARIGDVLKEFVERREVPGFVTLIARKGKIVHWEAYGRREIDSDEPMPKDAIFAVASMTKPVAVVSALMLFEEGRFLMHEPISTYMPEFRNPVVQAEQGQTVPAQREITAHDLFTHTSGVKDPLTRVEKYLFPTLAEHMADLAREPLQFQPGTQWLYGDSHDVLGYLVEVRSGERLDKFWQKKIFDPLGMSDSHYWLPAEKEDRRAILLHDGNSDPKMTSRYPAIAAERKTYVRAAGGLTMTAIDYWRFCQMLLNGGQLNGIRLLSPKTLEWMTTNHIGDLEMAERMPPGVRFGLGVGVVTDRSSYPTQASVGTYYWGGALGTSFWIDPDEELIGIVMAQVFPNQHLDYRVKFMTLAYASIFD
jgi:CubicO group peptidase (beta-lactamase class C family)